MSDMRSTLKGVVRDHRLPTDYKFHFNQPANTPQWRAALQRYFVVRQMTKSNVSIPLITLFVSWSALDFALFDGFLNNLVFLEW